MKAFAVLLVFFSILVSTGHSFVLSSFSPKAAGGCYLAPPNNGGGDPSNVALVQMLTAIIGEALKPINDKMDKMDHRFNEMEHRFDEMEHRVDDKFDSIGKELKSIGKELESADKKRDEALKPIHEKLDRVDKRTGLLVEEVARKFAARKFGEDFKPQLHDQVDS